MNKPPAFQFYPDDYLGGTRTMTLAQKGAYMDLLCLQWTQGKIHKDDIDFVCKSLAAEDKAKVERKFNQADDGSFVNGRLESERQKQIEYRERQSNNGRKGMAKRWDNDRYNGGYNDAITSLQPKHNSPSPSPSPIIDTQHIAPEVELPPRFPKTEQEAKAAAGTAGCSDELAVEVWNKAMGRHGRDAKDIPIRSWVHYLATEAKYQRQREAARKSSQPESKQIRETIFVKDL